jgi:hypothetical protein
MDVCVVCVGFFVEVCGGIFFLDEFVDHFVAVVKKGKILFEMDGVTKEQAQEAMRLASYKLPVKSKFLVKEKQG